MKSFITLFLNIVAWVFGIIFVIGGLSVIEDKFFPGLYYLCVGLVLIPLVRKILYGISKIELGFKIRAILVSILFFAGIFTDVIFYSNENKANIASESPQPQSSPVIIQGKENGFSIPLCAENYSGIGTVVNVRGSQSHYLYSSPSENSEHIINNKASNIIKETVYHSIGYSTRVKIICREGDFVKIQIFEPDYLNHVVGWTKKENLELPGQENKDRKTPSVLESPFLNPHQYIGLSAQEAGRLVGVKPNKVNNVIVDSEKAHMLLEANGNTISYVDIELLETMPCSTTKEFESAPILKLVGIDSENLEFARKKTYFHTYYDHKNKLKVSVSCLVERGPISIGFGRKYYGQ